MVLKIVWSPAKSYSIVPEPVKLEPKSGVTAANFKVPAAVKVIIPPPLASNVPSASKIPAASVKSKVPPDSTKKLDELLIVFAPVFNLPVGLILEVASMVKSVDAV